MRSRRSDGGRLRPIALLGLLLLASAPAQAAGRLVTFAAADGTQLVAMFYEAPARPAPGVVLVHMLGRSKEDWSLLADRLQAAGISALALDLRGHGRSGGSAADLSAMVADLHAGIAWLTAQPSVRADGLAMVGASLGANLAGLAAAEAAGVRALALVSPSLDYRGVRLDATVMKKIGGRPVWLAASAEDPLALRTVKELAADAPAREQHVSTVRAHGTVLLAADQDLARGLVDWLRRTLIS
jgi:alpha-beta hydrolase superfamily lysophospholipase